MTSKTIETIERNVGEGVYLARAAALLDLQQQDLARRPGRRRRMQELLLPQTVECLRRMRDELRYLHDHYRLVPRRSRR